MKKELMLVVSLLVIASAFAFVGLSPNELTGHVSKDSYKEKYGNSFMLASDERVFISNDDMVLVFIKSLTYKYNEVGSKQPDKVLMTAMPNRRDDIQYYFTDEVQIGKYHNTRGVEFIPIDLYDDKDVKKDWGEFVILTQGIYDYLGYFSVSDVKIIDGHKVELVNLVVTDNSEKRGYVDILVDGQSARLYNFAEPVVLNGLSVGLDTMSLERARLFFSDVRTVDF